MSRVLQKINEALWLNDPWRKVVLKQLFAKKLFQNSKSYVEVSVEKTCINFILVQCT